MLKSTPVIGGGMLFFAAPEIVRGLVRPTGEAIAAAAADHVPPEHLDDFVRMAVRELESLARRP
ncbi:MAG: hypothetical protein ABI882_15820 [Acidobacteriota bacterium]